MGRVVLDPGGVLIGLDSPLCPVYCGFIGQENQGNGNTEGGALRLPETLTGRRDSVSSLDSTVSSSVPASHTDLLEQYEVIKQQKDIIEHGINL